MSATVQWSQLAELIWVSVAAAAVVAVIFAMVILGAAHAESANRRGARVSAVVFGLLGAVSLATFLGAVVYGVSIIVNK